MSEQPLPRQLSDPLRALPVRGRRLVGDRLGRGQGDTVRRGVPALGKPPAERVLTGDWN